MHKTKISALIALLVIGFVISVIPVATASEPLRPMVFVHGGAGSAQQWESQAMRFTSNGYPANYIKVLEYDSSFTVEGLPQIWARLDVLIATLLAETGADKVDTLGHSLGTMVMRYYLLSPSRAAKVAHYVNIDGSSGANAPAGVPTIGIWSRPGAEMIGAVKNVWFDQTHVEVATSAESFFEMYLFFTGEEPEEKNIVPETGRISLAGRAVIFPQNIGVEGATLEIWKINSDTGARIAKNPEVIYDIGADGAWGPFKAKSGANYEFALVREGDSTHHYYRQPSVRSNYWISLLASSPAWGGVSQYMNRSENHACLVIGRSKEFWGDQGDRNDILEINGVNVVTANICPRIKLVNGMFVYDKDSDGVTDLSGPIPIYHAMIFFTGADLYMPAADPPDGTISIVSWSRGMPGDSRAVINLPNWASSNHRISVNFDSHHLIE